MRTAALLPALYFLSVGILGLPSVGWAQALQGVATDRSTGARIPGVVVSLLDEKRLVVATALSDSLGNFALTAPAPGAFALRAKRIGVRPLEGPPFVLGAGATRIDTLRLDPLAQRLTVVRATDRRTCVRRPTSDARTLELWEDARAALTASVITSRSELAGNVTLFLRELDPRTDQVHRYDQQEGPWTLARAFTSLDPDRLSRKGYVVRDDDNSFRYYAPDAHVLLSDAFAADHCFRVIAGRDGDEALVGLGFSPNSRQSVTGIEGVLWLSAATSELRRVDFEYVNLPQGRLEGRFGGTVHFRRLASGGWIVDDWSILMPMVIARQGARVEIPGREPLRGASGNVVVRTREQGGTVRLHGDRGDRLTNVSIAGTAQDSSGAPLAGAHVSLSAPMVSATTDSSGRFSFTGLRSGLYAATLNAPLLDSLGVRLPPVQARVPSGAALKIQLALPNSAALAGHMCGRTPDLKEAAVYRLIVLDRESAIPLAGIAARVSWRTYSGGKLSIEEAISGEVVQLDSTGAATVCGVPGNRLFHVESEKDAVLAWGDSVRTARGEVAWRVLRVGVERKMPARP